MTFEVFERKTFGKSKTPRATLQKGGCISLNAAAFALLGGGDADLHVELLYDRRARIIGLRVAPESVHTYPVRRQAAAASYLVQAYAYARHYGIELGVSRRYVPGKTRDGILTIQLADEGEVVSRRAKV